MSQDGPGLVAPVRGATRVLRASLVTLIVVSVSLACHVAGGGMRPSASAVAVVASLTALASTWLTTWRLSAPRLAVLMLLVEALTHVACAEMAPMHGMSHPVSLQMVAAHLAATALSVTYLRCGEEILWSMLQSWVFRVATPVLARPHLPKPGTSLVRMQPLTGRLDLGCAAIRGPPA